jgi:hypothetical protein
MKAAWNIFDSSVFNFRFVVIKKKGECLDEVVIGNFFTKGFSKLGKVIGES